MPTVPSDQELLKGVAKLIDECGGNQSAAARRMGVKRLRVNRLLHQGGRVTKPVQAELWVGLERACAQRSPEESIQPIQIVRDVPAIALQVIQYVVEAIEEHRLKEKGKVA